MRNGIVSSSVNCDSQTYVYANLCKYNFLKFTQLIQQCISYPSRDMLFLNECTRKTLP